MKIKLSCGFDQKKKGRWYRITKKHLNRSFNLVIEEVVVVWITDSFEDLLLALQTQKFF